MKKVLILCRRDDQPTYDQVSTYRSSLSRLQTGCDYTFDEYENLLFYYDGSKLQVLISDGETDIASFDTVFFTGWFKTKILEDVAHSVALYLESAGVSIVNSEVLHIRSRSKLSQYVCAVINDISATPFLFSLDPGILTQAIGEKWSFGYPIIMKGAQSNRGNDNYLVKDLAEAKSHAGKTGVDNGPWFVVQPFIPNDGDYRIIVMGEKVTAVIRRKSVTDSHINNTSKGGAADWLAPDELPELVLEESIKLAKLLHREITGVDMIKHKGTGKYYLLEINNMPQLATGSYVSDKLVQLDNYLANI